MPDPASPSHDSRQAPTADDLWAEGKAAFRARDYAGAAEALERLLASHDPAAGLDMAEVRLLTGVTLLRVGRTDDAMPHLRWAAELDPTSARAQQKLGAGIARQGLEAEALPHLERAAALAPGNAEYQWRLGDQYRRLGRLAEAKAAFERSLALDPDYRRASEGLAALERRRGSWLTRLARAFKGKRPA
jgi:tetratricopeptide (TPR) repeat protein